MTYDIQFSKKVLQYSDKHGVRSALRKFSISSDTYYRMKKRTAPDYVKVKQIRAFRKVDPEKLKAMALENPNFILADFAEAFHCSIPAVYYALKKLGFSFKK
jgi:transposase